MQASLGMVLLVDLVDRTRRKAGQAMMARRDERTHPSTPSQASGYSAGEPDSRQGIDTAVARVAEIESGAVQESQEIILRSLQDEREAFSSALKGSSRLTTTVDVLAGTVAEMTSVLRTQLDDAIEALQALREIGHPEARHPGPGPGPQEPQEQAVVTPSEAEAEPLAEPDTRPAEAESPPEPAPSAAAANPRIEPSPALTERFRQHITRMHDDGMAREEAERALLRFKLGHRFVGMLDDVYSSDEASAGAGRRG